MKRVNKFISLLLSLCLCLSGISVYAADITSAGSTGNSPVTLEMQSSSFSVSLPLGLLVEVTRDGEIYTATECAIINNSRSPIVVADVLVETDSPWVLEDFNAAYYSMPVNTAKLGFQLNTENVGLDGKVALDRGNWPVIYGYDEMELDYDANLPAVSEDKETVMGKVIFTIDFWADDNSGSSFDNSVFEVEEVNLSAEEASSIWVYTKTSDSVQITGYKGENSADLDLVVPTTIEELPVTNIYGGCFNMTLKSLSVPSGITISNAAFANLTVDTLTLNGVSLVQGSSSSNSNFNYINANNIYAVDSSFEKYSFNHGNVNTLTFKNCSFSEYALNNMTIGRLNLLEGCTGDKIAKAYINGDTNSIDTLYVDCAELGNNSFENISINNIIFGSNASSVGVECFADAKNITSIEGLGNLKNIGYHAFYSVQPVTVTETVHFKDATIGEAAFADHKNNISTVTFNFADVTFENCSIGAYAFAVDTFENVTITDSTVEEYAFYIASMESLTFDSSASTLANRSFSWATINKLIGSSTAGNVDSNAFESATISETVN